MFYWFTTYLIKMSYNKAMHIDKWFSSCVAKWQMKSYAYANQEMSSNYYKWTI